MRGRGPSRYFFVHIMKTAGTNFLVQFARQFPRDATWPAILPEEVDDPGAFRDFDTITNYLSVRALQELEPDERGRLRFIAGHIPFAAAELLGGPGPDLACLTILRDPVDRTISFLSQCRRDVPELRDQPLEAIYDDPWYFERFVKDFQTRVLSMTLDEAVALRMDEIRFADYLQSLIPPTATAEDRAGIEDVLAEHKPMNHQNTYVLVALLERLGVDMSDTQERYEAIASHPDYQVPAGAMGYLYADAAFSRPSPVDDDRFRLAVTNLERCAVVGLTEDYPAFITAVNEQFGLRCTAEGRANAGSRQPDEPASSFTRRIRDDNHHDIELYAAARALIAARVG
jgi:hypothetical protein